jgi:osmotically-inducible protein OsmY
LAISLHVQAQSPTDQSPGAAPPNARTQDEKSLNEAAHAANCALAKQVLYALVRDGDIDAIQVYVQARDGVVILMGAVPEWSQVERAAQIAKRVPGVNSVKTVLTLRTEA